MFLRMRWFVIGVATALGGVAYLADQLRKARERMTPRNLANTGLRSVADILDTAADAVKPDAQ